MMRKKSYGKTLLSLFLSLLMLLGSCTVVFAQTVGEDTAVYLSDLPYVSARVGWGELHLDEGLDGKTIRFRGGPDGFTYYDKGICAHGESEVVYSIEDMGAKTFQAYIGIHDGDGNDAKDRSSAEFIVQVDGVQLYKSSVILIGNGNVFVSVDIPAGAKELRLFSTQATNGIAGDHTAWADAKIVVAADSMERLKSVQLTAGKSLLGVGESFSINLSGKRVDGQDANLSEAALLFSSSDASVVSVDQEGKIAALKAGKATISCDVTLAGVTKRGSLDITVWDETMGNAWSVHSPSGEVKMIFLLDETGAVRYTVTRQGREVLGLAPIGLKTSLADFSTGLTFVSVSDPVEINERYTVISRKKAENVNHAWERVLTFSKGDLLLDVILRAYDDGMAFRYAIRRGQGSDGAMTISSESTGFLVPAGSKTWSMPHSSGAFSYEGLFDETTIDKLNGNISVPMLYETPAGDFALISEADLNGEYVGTMVKADGSGLLKVSYTPIQGSTAVQTSTPSQSPWRLVVIGDLADIVETDLVENLAPAPISGVDFSWVEPGISSWTWLVGGKSMQRNKQAILDYVDFAAEMGWRYFILDEGWQPDAPSGSGSSYLGYFDWFPEVVAHAKAKGIGLIAWVRCDDLNTVEKRTRLQDWAEIGIEGIKVDFFDRETQDRTALYNEIYRRCAELKLVVNAHGANKPTGEVRTYPNVLTRESIRGQEFGGLSALQYSIIPYVRTPLGPADITETVYPKSSANTEGFQVALSLLAQSGMHCLGSSIADYRRSPAYSFYKDMPVVWDDTRLVDGYPGEFHTILRRSGEDWYGASVSVDARDAVFPLDFLGEGSYYALIYRDGTAGNSGLQFDIERVTKADTLTIPMKSGGGCAVKILKDLPSTVTGISLGQSRLVLQQENIITLTADVQPQDAVIRKLLWTSSNPEVATVSSNGTVTALQSGVTTITVSSELDESVKAQCVITVVPRHYLLDTDAWRLVREHKGKIEFNAVNQATIYTEIGEMGADSQNRPIQNMLVRTPADDNFTITVKVTGGLYSSFQTAALAAFTDESHLVAATRRYHSSFGGNCFVGVRYEGGWHEPNTLDVNPNAPAYLKLTKQGNVFSTFYSYDGVNWTKIADITGSSVSSAPREDIKIGVFAATGSGTDEAAVTFEDFTYYPNNGETGIVMPFNFANKAGYETVNDQQAYVGDSFQATVTTPLDVTAIKLYNHNGNVVGMKVVNREVLADRIVWHVTTAVGTAGEERTLNVLVRRDTALFEDIGLTLTLQVLDHPPAVNSVSLDRSEAKVNEIFRATVVGSSGSKSLSVTNETGRAMGKALITRTRNTDGTITWVYEMCIGTAGENRTLIFAAAGEDGIPTQDTVQASLRITKA